MLDVFKEELRKQGIGTETSPDGQNVRLELWNIKDFVPLAVIVRSSEEECFAALMGRFANDSRFVKTGVREWHL